MGEILNLIESVSGGFPSYFFILSIVCSDWDGIIVISRFVRLYVEIIYELAKARRLSPRTGGQTVV